MRIAAIFSALVSLSAFAFEPLTIAERGCEPSCRIVARGNAPSLTYAAEEFRDWVEKLTDVRLQIDGGETTGEAKTVTLAIDTADDDAFRISRRSDGIDIVGGKRGVIYGVYELLESIGGVKWLSSSTTVIPRLERFVVPGDYARDETPAFALREGYCFDLNEHPEFALRLRYNGRPARPVEKHGGAYFLYSPVFRRGHTFFKLISPEEFFDSHPEYFSEVNGVRLKERTQLCLSNPDVRRIATERLLAYMRENPQYSYYGVSQMDWDNYCTCAACRAIDKEEGSHAGSVIRFVNSLADAVAPEFPDKFVETAAYTYSRKPPKTAPRKNVLVCLCSDDINHGEDIEHGRHAANVAFRKTMEKWGRLTDGNIYYHDYITSFAAFLTAMPHVKHIASNMKFCKKCGVKYMFVQGCPDSHSDFAELKNWLFGKLMWNPDLPFEPLLDEFFAGYYGAAAPFVRRYFDELHALPKPSQFIGMYAFPTERWRSNDFLKHADEILKVAVEAVKDDPVRLANVRLERAGIVHDILWRNARDFIGVWCTRDPERFRERAERYRDYLDFFALCEEDSMRRDGVMLRFAEKPDQNRRIEMRFKQMDELAKVPAQPSDRTWFKYDVMELGRENRDPARSDVERVSDGRAIWGTAVRINTGKRIAPNDRRCALQLRESEMALDDDATYQFRVRMRIEPDAAAPDGEVVQIGMYNDISKTCRVETFAPKRSEAGAGWTWYDAFSFSPQKGDRIFVNPGKYETAPAASNAFIDAFEVIRR